MLTFKNDFTYSGSNVNKNSLVKSLIKGSGCGLVGRVVDFDSRDPRLNPDIGKILSSNCIIEKTKIKK